MGLEGQLEDLPLVEMLQIIAFSKKSGYLRVSSAAGSGVVILTEGRVLFACSESVKVRIRELATEPERISFDGNRENIEASLRELSGLRDGSFRFEPTGSIGDELAGLRIKPFMVPGGLDPQEILLDLAVEIDSERREAMTLLELAFQNVPPPADDDAARAVELRGELERELEIPDLGFDFGGGVGASDSAPAAVGSEAPATTSTSDDADLEHTAFVRGMTRQLLGPGGTSDVSRLVLTVASRFLERGLLFLVKSDSARGLAGFGFGSSPSDGLSTARRIVLDMDGVRPLRSVMASGKTLKLVRNLDAFAGTIFEEIGKGAATQGVLVPMLYNRTTLILLYGDNGATGRKLGDLEGLELFMAQAGMALENKLLQRKLAERDRAVLESAG